MVLQTISRRWLPVLLCVGIISILTGCLRPGSPIIRGSGRTETRDFSLSDFAGIQAGNAFSIQVNRSDSFKVQVTADNNLWDSLNISVSNNILHLQSKPDVSIQNSTLKAVVTLPSITSLDLSGASAATISDFNSDSNMIFTLSGGSTINVGEMRTRYTTFDMSGGSNISGEMTIDSGKFVASGGSRVNLSGSGTDLTIDASGGSPVTLDKFMAESVSVILSGGSTARVNAKNITLADLSGGSNLYYVDSPVIGKVQTSGGSNIRQE
jgi:hypothetical protein